jgi:hypothetical protein
MAVNLVSIVTQFLTPELVARIASALGLDLVAAQKAIGGSVPAILAGLVGVSSKPEGARQLSGALAQQPPNILDNLTNVIGGSAQKAFAETGSNLLSTLLGGGATNALATSISKFAGISGAASSSLIGMLGPVVLGVLGKEQRSAGLDASGLASLLQSQKDQIAAAIPSGLADRLRGSGLLSALDSGHAHGRGRHERSRERGATHHGGGERGCLCDGQRSLTCRQHCRRHLAHLAPRVGGACRSGLVSAFA